MILELSKSEVREAVAKLLSLTLAGKDEDEIQALMGLTSAQLEQVKKELISREAERLVSRDNEEIYAEYVLNQLTCVRDLLRIQKDFKGEKNASALVGAVRARSDIFDKIVDRGQDLGFISKAPERKHITGGVLVAEMSNSELRKAILTELQTVQTMMKEIGGGGRDLLDVSVGPIHRELPDDDTDLSGFRDRGKSAKARNTKVNPGKGRKFPVTKMRDPVTAPSLAESFEEGEE